MGLESPRTAASDRFWGHSDECHVSSPRWRGFTAARRPEDGEPTAAPGRGITGRWVAGNRVAGGLGHGHVTRLPGTRPLFCCVFSQNRLMVSRRETSLAPTTGQPTPHQWAPCIVGQVRANPACRKLAFSFCGFWLTRWDRRADLFSTRLGRQRRDARTLPRTTSSRRRCSTASPLPPPQQGCFFDQLSVIAK